MSTQEHLSAPQSLRQPAKSAAFTSFTPVWLPDDDPSTELELPPRRHLPAGSTVNVCCPPPTLPPLPSSTGSAATTFSATRTYALEPAIAVDVRAPSCSEHVVLCKLKHRHAALPRHCPRQYSTDRAIPASVCVSMSPPTSLSCDPSHAWFTSLRKLVPSAARCVSRESVALTNALERTSAAEPPPAAAGAWVWSATKMRP